MGFRYTPGEHFCINHMYIYIYYLCAGSVFLRDVFSVACFQNHLCEVFQLECIQGGGASDRS